MQKELITFIDYVNSFYGKSGVYADDFDNGGFAELVIVKACVQYYEEAGDSWGFGDSIDRERVRTILEPNYSPNL